MMRKQSCRSLLLVLLLLPILASCEGKQPVSNNTLAGMLRVRLTKDCNQQTVYIRAGKFGTGKALHAEAWFDNFVLTDPRFVHVAQFADDAGTHGELSYKDNGDTFRATWTLFDQPFDLESNQLTIIACVYVPKSTDIIDASFDTGGKTARVTFQAKFKLSLLGRLMNDAGVLKRYDPLGAPPGYEYIALLSQSKSGQWRIRGLGVN